MPSNMNRREQHNPEWLNSQPVQTIFNVFAKNNETVYAVGGCVRNAVMGIPESGDIDFSTPVTPDRVNDMFVAAGYRTEPTGIEHGTVSVIINHVAYEVTTFRRDVATDGRRAVVAFTTEIIEDAERRDFTFNALYMDAEGYVYDPWGDVEGHHSGLDDAKNRMLRFVGSAGQRIQEDYLRILRLYRFMACLNVRVDSSALWACSYYRRGLEGISGERIEKEIVKLLASENPIPAVTEMIRSEVGQYVLGVSVDRYDEKGFVHLVHNGPRDPAVRLAYLLFGNGGTAILNKWNSSNELKSRVSAAQTANLTMPCRDFNGSRTDVLKPDETDHRVRHRMFVKGKQAVIDSAWVMYAMANQDGDSAPKRDAHGMTPEVIERWSQLEPPIFPIKGQDLLDMGLPPGPAVGKIMREVEQCWIEADFPNRERTLVLGKTLVGGK